MPILVNFRSSDTPLFLRLPIWVTKYSNVSGTMLVINTSLVDIPRTSILFFYNFAGIFVFLIKNFSKSKRQSDETKTLLTWPPNSFVNKNWRFITVHLLLASKVFVKCLNASISNHNISVNLQSYANILIMPHLVFKMGLRSGRWLEVVIKWQFRPPYIILWKNLLLDNFWRKIYFLCLKRIFECAKITDFDQFSVTLFDF